MSPANHLVVMARAPRLGRVKRRLAADVGSVPATAFYRAVLDRLVRRLAHDPRWRLWLAVTPDRDAQATARLAGPRVRPIGQGPGDLGARMGRLFADLPPGPAVIVGSDIPDMRARHIAAAFAALGDADAVFGPAADGGFWLVGARRRPRVLPMFDNVRWSTEHALADTLANLPRRAKVRMLDQLEDVDDGAAYGRWRARGGAVVTPRLSAGWSCTR